MPTSETMVTNASVAIAVGLWYAAQSYVSPLLQVAVLATIGLVLPAIYRRLAASASEYPTQHGVDPVPGHSPSQSSDAAPDPTPAD
ncbi:hypothetical protein [Natronoarchaeum rubrum]|uniref:hypothetical protein n=1 Tax=Natronoarchaeum rubrum TaxID=755311 RepID=UPI002112645E|nr:hypothetical protein [Natronoarchaeum rubrum]HMB50450.1 hypothetical protein [Natronoarchaeum rubrum]